MSVFVTGATGYLGSYVAGGLLAKHPDRLALLVRARNLEEAKERLWRSLQLHLRFDQFLTFLETRVDVFLGDITEPRLGLDATTWTRLVRTTDSVIHVAASLNRKSSKACFNVNLRGTLEVIELARAAHAHHGLRRFSDVSTVAVAGVRSHETVPEERMIEWNRSDYDPYARTKKFCEHMIEKLLPDVPRTVFRPSTVLGDSRFAETTQFDMVRAFAFMAGLPVLPLDERWRMDIVSADYVGDAIVGIHQAEHPRFGEYNLSAGEDACTYGEIVQALAVERPRVTRFAPRFAKLFGTAVRRVAETPPRWRLSGAASLMMVFWPYLTFDTVFSNRRVVSALNRAPTPFSKYAARLLRFARDGRFTYPYQPWPEAGRLRVAS